MSKSLSKPNINRSDLRTNIIKTELMKTGQRQAIDTENQTQKSYCVNHLRKVNK